jgi:hypothetical protein
MATYSKIPLSGSTDGRMVAVAQTATAGTLIHTAISSTTGFDEVWMYAVNSSTSAVKLTLEWGGTTANTDHIELTIAPESGLVLVTPGLILRNSLVVRAFAGTTNVINIAGYVNRVS